MLTLLLLCRLALAVVFLASGAAKLLDYRGSRKSMADFGLPAFLASPVAVLLPPLELICAAALLVDASAIWAAAAVAALLVVFTVAIGLNLARGHKPSCHCFGKLSSNPISWKELARNAGFLALAGLVIWQGRENPGEWPALSAVGIAMLAMGAALVLTWWFLLQMLRQNGRLLLRVEALEQKAGVEPNAAVSSAPLGLPVGESAPQWPLEGVEGDPGKPVLVLFTSQGCGACDELMPDVERWKSEHSDRLRIVTVSSHDISQAYQVTGTPSAVLVEAGKIASPLAAGADEVRNLVARSTLPSPAKKGESVPRLRLTDLEGETVDLASFRGRRRLLLFWNPDCGFCQEMLDDIKSWEHRRSKDAPELVVISSGARDVNRQLGFRSTVLLDPVFGAGNVLGAAGTPSGVIIDEEGRVASEVGVGAPAVLSLARMAGGVRAHDESPSHA